MIGKSLTSGSAPIICPTDVAFYYVTIDGFNCSSLMVREHFLLLRVNTRGEVEGYDAIDVATEAEALKHAQSEYRQSRLGVELWRGGRLLASWPGSEE